MSAIPLPIRPKALKVLPDGIPSELKKHSRWVVWTFALTDKGKWTKPPYRADGRGLANSKDPATWTTFEVALAAYQSQRPLCEGHVPDGIGFMFEGSGYFGVDLDHCRDPRTGETKQEALDIVKALDCWAEVSVSGEGIHVVGRGKLPKGWRRLGWIEVYDSGRYFTITGHVLDGSPQTILNRQDAIEAFHKKYLAVPPQPKAAPTKSEKPDSASPPAPNDLDDARLIDLARGAANGSKFCALWAGDTHGYPSHSEADLALCCRLAFWTRKDPQRVDRLFRRSGLYRPWKWDRPDYRARTIAKAIEGTTEEYTPGRKVGRSRPPALSAHVAGKEAKCGPTPTPEKGNA